MATELSTLDYFVVMATLVVSAIIGIKFRPSSKKTATASEYLLAGKDMPRVPVILSISVTLLSAITLIGSPAEVYRFGPKNIIKMFVLPFGMAAASFVFIPVYFQCGVCTVYEYLEIRFGKAVRYAMSLLFIFQMVLYMSSALYAPILALNAVTGLPVQPSVIIFGSICATYCAIGGLKGVLWTDVFQCCLICFTIVAFYVAAIPEAGGFSSIWERATEGGRTDVFDFDLSLTKRYTFWNCLAAMLVHGFSSYGANQVEVQRLLSLKTVKKARTTLLISSLPLSSLYLLCNLFGIVLFAIYYRCDPVADGLITKYDQLLPYYLVSRFHTIPGMTGLCVAGIFSGALSTVSSVLNSVATVTVVDFVRPILSSNRLTEARAVSLAKILSLLYGLLAISLSLFLLNARSIREVSALMTGSVEGPAAAIFTIGVLTKKGSSKSVSLSLLLGVSITAWIAYGIFNHSPRPVPLPLDNSECLNIANTTRAQCLANCTAAPPAAHLADSDTFFLYKLSFNWVNVIGFFGTIIITYIINIISGGWDNPGHHVDTLYLSPVTRFWMKPQSPDKEVRDNEVNAITLLAMSSEEVEGSDETFPEILPSRQKKEPSKIWEFKSFLRRLRQPRNLIRIPESEPEDTQKVVVLNRNSKFMESEA